MSASGLQNKHIVLGVAGGIAAYKSVELLRLLTKAGAEVQVVMTERARRFVGELTFQALSGRQVFFNLFDLQQESEIGHIQVADRADLVIIAPATADVIARMATGMTDDAVTAMALATKAKVLLAPSMNVNMWSHPITQANVRRLMDMANVAVVGPGDGFLACRWTGPGRLAEPADIKAAAKRLLTQQDWAGKTVVISAGPTREAIDPVRYISNHSSGKMGYALADAAGIRGAEVRLVSGPVALEAPLGVERIGVTDARAMEGAVREAARGADAVIMAAAVADFRPRLPSGHKLPKSSLLADSEGLALERNPDILAGLSVWRSEQAHELGYEGGTRRPLLVGFAAETRDLLQKARDKLAKKGCDLIVANDVSEPDAGFEVDTNRVIIVGPNGEEHLELASKEEIAHGILDRIITLL